MTSRLIRFLVGAVLLGGVAACSKPQYLSAATIHGRSVLEADLPALTKVVETTQSRLGLWTEDIPRDVVDIQVTHPKHGQLRYFYSPSKKAILWLDDPRNRKFGCSVSGHSAITIETCFKHAE